MFIFCPLTKWKGNRDRRQIERKYKEGREDKCSEGVENVGQIVGRISDVQDM